MPPLFENSFNALTLLPELQFDRIRVDAAGEVHTGWPKTAMIGETVTGPNGSTVLFLQVSERNESRYSVFHGVDIRISREFDVASGDLTAFLEITNLYDCANPCCTEYSFLPNGSLASRESHWLPLVPSLGAVWRF